MTPYFPWKTIWKVRISSKVALWTAAWRNILTVENLRKWNMRIVDWCCICKHSEETTYYLLFHCDYVYDLMLYGGFVFLACNGSC